ncbi:MAG: tyrosine-type recombinase/integrase [Kosmotoga sp.]|nr:MAG: tyrosine-type recombinase/integrase [Kosmotoga sp.]
MEYRKAMEKFQDYMEYVRNLSRNTVEAYIRDLKNYEKFIDNEKLDYKEVTRRDIEKYMQSLSRGEVTSKKLSPSSIARNLSSISTFYTFLHLSNVVQAIPTEMVRTPKRGKTLPEYVSHEDIQKLINSFSDTSLGKRNKAIVALMYYCGLRVSEVTSLKKRDVELYNDALIQIRSGKGNKDRVVPLSKKAEQLINEYMEIRESFNDSEKLEELFVGIRGERVSRKSIHKMITKQANKVFPGRHITPHVLRHSCATHLLQRGASVKVVQEILGHSNVSTTSIYLHITDKEKRKAVKLLSDTE